ncbi:DUF3307 domain-containing protein [Oceanobacillus neutriphilus]|uniref:DUF3307 domain-containing protein n=1 Tax=Oceanobacillus neutriphilus TaxID=531815 RepID=A0ABQ2NUJ4_9BACI|nr:DUF3307 domain-containing protein [Oceanobacillus neutriphilus]GGP10842.1 hypothetical protein GCM10011346_20570 [Oceanobacillus neutriphilus]
MTILLLLLAHLIADFWLQTDQMVQNKIKYLKKHTLHHLMTTGIALAIIWGYQYEFENIINYLILPLIFIIMTHLVIDLLKIKLVDSISKSPTDNIKSLGYFLSDQVLHVIMIVITCTLFFHMTAAEMTAELFHLYGTDGLSLFNTALFISIIYILATSVSGHMVKFIIGSLPSEFANFESELTLKNQIAAGKEKIHTGADNRFTEEYHYFTYSTPLRSRGKLIGYLERLLVIVLTAVGAYPSIAFIIAAKSIARFKQLDDRNWAEYFLLGTLSSIFLGLVLGLVVQGVLM